MPSAEVGGEVRRNRAIELLAVGAVVDPLARRGDPLARASGCGITDQRQNITMAARLRPKDAKPVLGIMVGYPLDMARENFLGRGLRLRYLSH